MLKAKIGKEVVVRMTNEVGVLARIAKIVADKGVNILAASAWVEGTEAVIRLVTDDQLRIADALREKKFAVRETDVVLTEAAHKPGMLRHLTETLADKGIDLRYLYASATAGQDKSLVVLSSMNNERAVVLLNA